MDPIPLVRCRLDGPDGGEARSLRYVPLAEFGLWRHLMETRHGRRVEVEAVSVWVSDASARKIRGCAPDDLEPVLRVRLEVRGARGVGIPVERFFPAETYPQAREALLSHFQGERGAGHVVMTPGYFLPPGAHVDRGFERTADAA